MKVHVVVPVCRPDGIQRSVENFDRQTYGDKSLLLVLNGAARGYSVPSDVDVITSEPHQSLARNAALEYLRPRDAYVVCMDDDDYYGPGYLREHVDLAKHGRLVGKQPFWVRFKRGHALFRREHANQSVGWVRGGTIGGYARELPDFPVQPVAEELALCDAFRAQGGEVWASGLGHAVYDRSRRDHTFGATPAALGYLWGPWCEWYQGDVFGWVNSDAPPPGGEKRKFSQLVAE